MKIKMNATEPELMRYQVIGGPNDGEFVEFESGRLFSQIVLTDEDGFNHTYKRRVAWVDPGNGCLTWRVYYVLTSISQEEWERRAQEIEDASRKTVS